MSFSTPAARTIAGLWKNIAAENLTVCAHLVRRRAGELPPPPVFRNRFSAELDHVYRERILPNLAKACRGVYQRYQVEPDKVNYNDIVTAQRTLLRGDVPSPIAPPPGCPFHPRCPQAMPICSRVFPQEKDVGTPDAPHRVACHLYT